MAGDMKNEMPDAERRVMLYGVVAIYILCLVYIGFLDISYRYKHVIWHIAVFLSLFLSNIPEKYLPSVMLLRILTKIEECIDRWDRVYALIRFRWVLCGREMEDRLNTFAQVSLAITIIIGLGMMCIVLFPSLTIIYGSAVVVDMIGRLFQGIPRCVTAFSTKFSEQVYIPHQIITALIYLGLIIILTGTFCAMINIQSPKIDSHSQNCLEKNESGLASYDCQPIILYQNFVNDYKRAIDDSKRFIETKEDYLLHLFDNLLHDVFKVMYQKRNAFIISTSNNSISSLYKLKDTYPIKNITQNLTNGCCVRGICGICGICD